MRKGFLAVAMMAACLSLSAQTTKRQVVENGGTGPFKAEVVADAGIEAFTIYRPQNLKEVVAKNGKLPVLLYANGACANNNQQMRLLLNEVTSYGYVVAAIGPYDEEDPIENWRDVLNFSFPEEKESVVLANGEVMKPMSEAEKKAYQEQAIKRRQQQQQQAPAFRTYAGQLLEVLDWLIGQNADAKSEYYHCLDLDKVAAMGQSCGGAQVLGVTHDPRIKTGILLNSGVGDMEMQGASAESLKNLHQPMLYLIGGQTDIAFGNAQKDFERITGEIPVVMINSKDGHNGTYYEKNGGPYAVAVHKWLDWQLKGKVGQAGLFMDDETLKLKYPDWTVVRKNW